MQSCQGCSGHGTAGHAVSFHLSDAVDAPVIDHRHRQTVQPAKASFSALHELQPRRSTARYTNRQNITNFTGIQGGPSIN